MRSRVLVALLLGVASAAGGAPTLDPTFGTGGLAALTVIPRLGRTVALLPDGRILVAGLVLTTPSQGDLGLNRLLPDGTIDATFGTAGRVVQDLGSPEERATALMRQPDGQIVVASTLGPPIDDAGAIARFDADGTLDPTFGTGGIVTTSVGSIEDLALQADGSIVVAGTVRLPGPPFPRSYMWIGRLDAQGVPDAGFGTGGVVHLDRGGADVAASLVVEPSGAVVVAGGSSDDFLLQRVDADGAPDPTFGTGGVVTTDFQVGAQEGVRTLLRQPDGKLVAVGSAVVQQTASAIAVARYDQTGAPDPFFGNNGMNVIGSGDELASSAALDAAGRVVVGGTRQLTSGFLMRLSAGVLDPGWPLQMNQVNLAAALAIQPDSRIVGLGDADAFRALTGDDCGNAAVDPGESCDDGNTTGGDCCSALCFVEPDGSLCSDGDQCTVGDACTGGACIPGAAAQVTQPCAQCEPATGLPVARPRTGCKTTVRPGRALLKLTDGGERFSWRWNDGAATAAGELGDPIGDASSAHDVCVFDESGPTPALVAASTAASNLTPDCVRPPCWRVASDGRLTYRSGPPNAAGLASLQLRPGTGGRARVRVKGTGLLGGPIPLPPSLPLRVQVWARGAACFEAVHSASGVRRSDARRFQGASD